MDIRNENKIVRYDSKTPAPKQDKRYLPVQQGQDLRTAVLDFIDYLEDFEMAIEENTFSENRYDTGIYLISTREGFLRPVSELCTFVYEAIREIETRRARRGRKPIHQGRLPIPSYKFYNILSQLSLYLGCHNLFFGIGAPHPYPLDNYLDDYRNPYTETDWYQLRMNALHWMSHRSVQYNVWDGGQRATIICYRSLDIAYGVSNGIRRTQTLKYSYRYTGEHYKGYHSEVNKKNNTKEYNQAREEAAKKVLAGEEARLRAFVDALFGTLRYIDALSLSPDWNVKKIHSYGNLRGIIRLLKTLIGAPIEQEEDMSTPSSQIVDSYVSDIEDEETDYYEETEVEPVKEEKVTESPAVTVDETHTYLGKDIKEDSQTKGNFIQVNDVDRQAGMYIEGVQRMGKSSLLENLIYQDLVKGFAVIVLDPHGDLINNVIAQMPQERINFTYLLDITDIDYPYGINLFYCKDPSDRKERARTVGRVKTVFEKIFPELERQQYAPHMLEAIAETFLDNQGHTLADVKRLLTDSEFRRRLVRQVTNRGVRNYWENFNNLSNTKKETQSQPLLNKLQEFLLKDFIANIVEQKETTIDIREAIMGKVDRSGKIQRSVLLIHLPVEDDTYRLSAELIGTMLLAEIYSTTFGFGDLAPKDRPTFSLYVDEFQNFATSDFAKLFAQGGKFGIRQTVAHQYRSQLSIAANRDATLSATTRVVFRTIDDSELAKTFSDLSFSTRPERIPRKVFEHLATYKKSPDEWLNETVRQFARIIVEKAQRHEKDEVLHRWRYFEVIPKTFGDATFEELLTELELLLFEAMDLEDKDVRQSDRYFRVVGMLSLWKGFKEYFIVEYLEDWYQKEEVPQDHEKNYEYQEWKKVTEMLQDKDILEKQKHAHLVFVGGLDIVLDTLKRYPIGEEKETTDSERAAMLRDLEKGVAWAKIGSKSFVLDTFALSAIRSHQRLTDIKTEKRKQHIVNQTRRKYCRRRSEIEEELQEKETLIHKATEEEESLGTESKQKEWPRFEDE